MQRRANGPSTFTCMPLTTWSKTLRAGRGAGDCEDRTRRRRNSAFKEKHVPVFKGLEILAYRAARERASDLPRWWHCQRGSVVFPRRGADFSRAGARLRGTQAKQTRAYCRTCHPSLNEDVTGRKLRHRDQCLDTSTHHHGYYMRWLRRSGELNRALARVSPSCRCSGLNCRSFNNL